jgi:hypothetical protein
MRKILFTMSLALCWALNSNAQEVTNPAPTEESKAWSILGQNTLMLNQSSFSNWVAGGANNVGWLAGINYNFTYQKDKDLWENNIIVGYGMNKTQSVGLRKTQDIININTNYGRAFAKSWYAAIGAGFESQFAPGYKDGNNPAAAKISNWMAPGYLNVGLGATYKPNTNFTLKLYPANAKWTFVTDPSLQLAGVYGLKNNGDASLFQFGFLAEALYRVTLMENIKLENRASVFSNYLDHPDHLVLTYDGVLNMKVNKFISANVTLGLRYNHNEIWKTQVKQTLGIGFAYNVDNGRKASADKRHKEWKK